jgi:SAM-dependent methyltransferase
MPRISVHDFYNGVLAEYGDTARGLHYNSDSSQQIRFRVLRELLPERLAGLTIVDVGCGFGDLLRYFQEANDPPGHYIGMDLHERMVEVARERTGAEIIHGDVLADSLPAADWYVCSGSLNNFTLEETKTAVERCYGAARAGLVFNVLRGDDWSNTFNYRQPAEVQAWAEELGAEVKIVDGYLYRDFTAALVRPGN